MALLFMSKQGIVSNHCIPIITMPVICTGQWFKDWENSSTKFDVSSKRQTPFIDIQFFTGRQVHCASCYAVLQAFLGKFLRLRSKLYEKYPYDSTGMLHFVITQSNKVGEPTYLRWHITLQWTPNSVLLKFVPLWSLDTYAELFASFNLAISLSLSSDAFGSHTSFPNSPTKWLALRAVVGDTW